MGPTPLLAANFVMFGVIIDRLGTQYSRLSPKSCKRTTMHDEIVPRLIVFFSLS